jgi:hypothetical protein
VTEVDRTSAAGRTSPFDRVETFLEWPHGIARLGVVLCVLVTVGFGLVYFVRAVDRLGDDASRNASYNYDDREFAGGNAIVTDKRALYEARALIPEDETYRVVTGPHLVGGTELTRDYFSHYARYFLMPRLPAEDARWILCVGCDPGELGAGFRVLWRDETGAVLGRLEG